MVFDYINDQCPNYLNEVFQTTTGINIQTRKSSQNVTTPFCNTLSQMVLSYIGKSIWSKIPERRKHTKNLNMFKHNLKEHQLKELRDSNFCWLFLVVVNFPS